MRKLFTLLILMLTAMAVNAASYNIWVKGIQVTDANKNDILGDGKGSVWYWPEQKILTLKDATISSSTAHVIEVGSGTTSADVNICIEGKCTLNATTHGITVYDGSSCTVYSSMATNYDGELTISNASKGGFAIQATNSTLRITNVTINATTGAGINGRKDNPAKSIVIWDSNLNIKSVSTSATALGAAKSISINGCNITPSGSAYNSSLLGWASNGTLCSEVKTTPKEYNLSVAGKKVTTRNESSIVGEGKVKYDSKTNTLTLMNKALIEGGSKYGIEASGDLNISLEGNSKITSSSGHGIYASGNLTISGDGPYATHLDIITQANGYADLVAGKTLTIKDCSMDLTSNYECISGTASANLVVNRAILDMTASSRALYGIASFKLTDCYLNTPSNAYFSSSVKGLTTDGSTNNVKSAKILSGKDTVKPILPSDKTFKFEDVSDTSVKVTWNPSNDNNGELQYRVCYCLTNSTSGMTNVKEQTGTSYTFTGLKPGTSYNFEILAFDAAGNTISYGVQKHTTTVAKYGLIVNGISVTSGNANNIMPNGAATYNPSTKILVLSNAKLTDRIVNTGIDALIIELRGTNTSTSYIQLERNTSIKGTGSFTSNVTDNLGIYLFGANLIVESGTIDVSGHTGIKSAEGTNTLTVKKGATVYATGSKYGSFTNLKSIIMDGCDFMDESGDIAFDVKFNNSNVEKRGVLCKSKIGIGNAYYGVKIGGTKITSSNASSYINSKFDYNKISRTLTLNGYSGSDIIVFDTFDTSVILKGSNTTGSFSIYNNADFSGTGSLKISNNNNTAIYCEGNLSFENCTIDVTAKNNGIAGKGSNTLTIKNAHITATTGSEGIAAIRDFKDISLTGVNIILPTDAKVSNGAIVDSKGNVIKSKVEIASDNPYIVAPTLPSDADLKLSSTSSNITVEWNAASDNITSAANLKYWVYVSTVMNNVTSEPWKKIMSAHDQDGAITGSGSTFKLTTQEYSEEINSVWGSMEPNTTFYVTVVVEDEDGNCALYNVGTVSTLSDADTTKPTLPADATVKVTEATENSLTISWDAASDNKTDAANLNYEINVQIDGAWNTLATLTGVTEYKIEGLKPESKYKIVIYVSDESGNQCPYDALTASTEAADAIESILAADPDVKMYNTSGVLVGKNYRGVVIINGKKYIKK